MTSQQKKDTERQIDERLLLELKLASRFGAALFLPTHLLLALMDFVYDFAPWPGLLVRLLSIALIFALVWFLHRMVQEVRWVRRLTYLTYAVAMLPVFVLGILEPRTFLEAFVATLVGLAVFLPSEVLAFQICNAVATAGGLTFIVVTPATLAARPFAYILIAVVNTALIAAGGSYLAARRRREAAKWHVAAERLDEVLEFGEGLARLGLLQTKQLAELRKLAAGREDYSHEHFLKELTLRGQITEFQAKTILEGGLDALRAGSWIVVAWRGEGGMGQVFEVRHAERGERGALKRLRPECQGEPESLRRFQREMQVMAQLRHENIVKIYDVFLEGSRPEYVMEFVEGGSLADRLPKGKRLEEPEVRRLATDLGRALDHAHGQGIVHRDLKPENVLLDAQGNAKLSDFGLAHLRQSAELTALTRSGVVMGTFDYMAPEQAKDPHHVDIRADLYSLGCTLYHALTGRPPFLADAPVQKMMAHQCEAPIPLNRIAPKTSKGMSAIVLRLLAKHPSERFQTPRELLRELGVS